MRRGLGAGVIALVGLQRRVNANGTVRGIIGAKASR